MNIIIEEIVNNVVLQIEEVVSTVIIEVSEMQVPGKDAYQSAVDGGFVGTEIEFNTFLSEIGTFATISELDTKLDITDYNDRFKGVYLTESALIAAYPTAAAGDQAQVNEVGATDVVNYSWDAEENIWVNNGTGGSGAINTDALPEGTSNLYFTTDRVLNTILSGISFLTGTAITATDSILVAFGKLQKQISDKQNVLTDPLTGIGSQNDPNTYALQDGTILYHSVKWFVPTSTVSTSGTTVTSVGAQFTSVMIGAKLIINGEWRIITAFTNSSNVTVSSSYSVNYSGVVAGSWGVYSKSLQIVGGEILFYATNGNNRAKISTSPSFSGDIDALNNGFQLRESQGLKIRSALPILWTSGNNADVTPDIALRRNSAGVLEIYDGITAIGLEANRRDLLVRNVTASQFKLTALNTAPASATDTGVLGEIRVTATHIYVCIATNVWTRTALTTW